MTVAAVLSQPLRAPYCMSYLEQSEDEHFVVLVSAHDAFDKPLPGNARLVIVKPWSAILPTTAVAGSSLRRRLLRWTRGGSTLGAMVERLARSALRRGRAPTRGANALGHDPEWAATPPDPMDSPLFEALEARNAESPISEVVVFDVYDLPPAIAFADRHGLPVKVR